MRCAAVLAVLACVPGVACTGALERHLRDLRHAVAELARQRSADRLRREEIANRLLVLEEELARLRRASAPAARTPQADDPTPPSLPVVRLSPTKPGASPRADPPGKPAAAPPVADGPPKALYARGLRAFRAGDDARALALFRAFGQKFADHSLADNALYWTGRSLSRLGRREGAIAAYERLLRRYPTGNKVPDALLALAALLEESGQRSEARAKLARVVRTFPASDAAKRAARRLQEMKP